MAKSKKQKQLEFSESQEEFLENLRKAFGGKSRKQVPIKKKMNKVKVKK